MAASLSAELDAAQNAAARGNSTAAGRDYQAFINDVNAQTGKSVAQEAASVLITDAELLIAYCP